ncbi:MAG: dihydrodipicolinate synthase family protein [Promethearchaeota archaeon]
MNGKRLKGLVSAPFSPLNVDGSINREVIGPYAEFLNNNGVIGVFVNGTSGEGFSLTTKERMLIAEKWMENAPPGFKVMIHVGHTSIEATKEMAKHAQDIGAHAFGSMAPIFFKPGSVKRLVEHCAIEAAAAPDIPYYFYHIPIMSGVDFPMISYLAIADQEIPNLGGIKYSKPEPADFKECLSYKEGKYEIMYGQDQSLLSALILGAKSAIGSTYNYATPLYHRIIKAFDAGDHAKANELQLKSIKMIHSIFKIGDFLAACNVIMRWLGIDLGPVRSPLKNFNDNQEKKLKEVLEDLGFFEYCCN